MLPTHSTQLQEILICLSPHTLTRIRFKYVYIIVDLDKMTTLFPNFHFTNYLRD